MHNVFSLCDIFFCFAYCCCCGGCWCCWTIFSTLELTVSGDHRDSHTHLHSTERDRVETKIKLNLNTKTKSFEFRSRLLSFRFHWENYRKLLYFIFFLFVRREKRRRDVFSELSFAIDSFDNTERQRMRWLETAAAATAATKTFSFFPSILHATALSMTSMLMHIDSMVTANAFLSFFQYFNCVDLHSKYGFAMDGRSCFYFRCDF